MKRTPYADLPAETFILRDKLAIERTLLANERTLLAYLRSALSLVIVGITFIHFFQIGMLLYIGLVSIPSGLGVAALGIVRYRRMDRTIRRVYEPADPARPTIQPSNRDVGI